jgi:hypothetical protein
LLALSKLNIPDAGIPASKVSGLADVATSGSYDDLDDRPTIPANIVTYTQDQNNNITLNRNPSLTVSGGSNTDFGQLVEDFVVNNAAINTLIQTAINNALLNAFPSGSVIMWVGSITDIPSGWEILEGIASRFPVGIGGQGTPTGLSPYSVGSTGGEEFHALTVNEMPKHSHAFTAAKQMNGNADSDGNTKDWLARNNENLETEKTGGTSERDVVAHENRPPYYALYFLKKR